MPQTLGVYDVYGTLGKGSFSRIRFAVNRENGLSYAIKIYDKSKLRDNGMLESTRNEIAVMKSLDHKNIVGIRDMFASKEKIYLVLDLMMGGSLRQKLNKRQKFSEDRTRHYFQVLVGVLEYCHGMGVIIGGLSLEGILIDSEGSLKLSDFGCACMETVADVSNGGEETAAANGSGGNQQTTKASTGTCASYYMAPEMVEHNIGANRSTDIWSLGVVLYAMHTGFMPFDISPTLPEMLRNIRVASYTPFPEWFNEDLTDLLEQILVADPQQRATLPTVMGHAWSKWEQYVNQDTDFNDEDGVLSEEEFSDDGDDEHRNYVHNNSSHDMFGEDSNLCANALKTLPFIGFTELFMAPIRMFQSASSKDANGSSSARSAQKAPTPAAAAAPAGEAAAAAGSRVSKKKEDRLLQHYVQQENAKAAGTSSVADPDHDNANDSSDDGEGGDR
jgi:serine/threonine protein kinase